MSPERRKSEMNYAKQLLAIADAVASGTLLYLGWRQLRDYTNHAYTHWCLQARSYALNALEAPYTRCIISSSGQSDCMHAIWLMMTDATNDINKTSL